MLKYLSLLGLVFGMTFATLPAQANEDVIVDEACVDVVDEDGNVIQACDEAVFEDSEESTDEMSEEHAEDDAEDQE